MGGRGRKVETYASHVEPEEKAKKNKNRKNIAKKENKLPKAPHNGNVSVREQLDRET